MVIVMRILVAIGHPAHVHFFKNFIWEMKKRGHNVFINTVDKELTLYLLNKYNLEYEVYGRSATNFFEYVNLLLKGDLKTYKTQKKYDIDIIVGIANIFGAHISKITKAKSLSFTDTESASFSNLITIPFVNQVFTPSCFKKDFGKKQIRYNGYHELAYLHPNYFIPNPEVLTELGLNGNDTYIIMRFVSWGATHDVGHHGLTLGDKKNAVKEFEKYGRVFITSEKKLPEELEKYRITVSPEKIHHLLYYATFMYGESATMSSEAAVLGTHSTFCDSSGRGYTEEEESKYGLVYNFYDEDSMGRNSLSTALKLLSDPDLKKKGREKRDKLIADKIDVTKFIVDAVEKYNHI
ncbi:MAG: DUF354 domain-containing protein [Methanococcaceae archaeon]